MAAGIRLLDNASWKPEGVEGVDGRVMGGWSMGNGTSCIGLLEWTTASAVATAPQIDAVMSRLSTYGSSVNRPEEAQTFKANGFVRIGSRTALVYQCPHHPMTLRQLIDSHPKPPCEERQALALTIANKVRSLHVHFDLRHPCLRPESFVFLVDPATKKPIISRPFILDWARQPTNSIYRHPRHRPEKDAWTYPVWSLLMILVEIAQWKSLIATFPSEQELLKKKQEVANMMRTSSWKCFTYALSVIDKGSDVLDNYDRWRIKKFYDLLCESLA